MDFSRFRVQPDSRVSLRRHDPGDTGGFKSKKKALTRLERGVKRLAEL